MKKKVTVILVSIFFLNACKKEYTCTCTYEDNNGNSKSETYDLGKQDEDNAKKHCEEHITTLEAAGGKNVVCNTSKSSTNS